MSLIRALPLALLFSVACGAESADPGVSNAGAGQGAGTGPSSNGGGGAGSGAPSSGGATNAQAGAGVGGSFVGGGAGGAPALPPLDCGANGVAIENAGPTKNRVNYVILGDGYGANSVATTFIEHVNFAMKKRFSAPIGEPYLRYRKFVNICALKIVSETDGIGNGATPMDCTGDDESRLAHCDTQAAEALLDKELPATFEVDWHAIMLNNDRWWNTGSPWMLWSGAHEDAAGAALHEGGHGFHQLADEYEGTSSDCGEGREVNSTADATGTNGKWMHWLGYDATDATGKQDVFQGSRYCSDTASQYRPSDNSMMNMLFGDDPDTSYNSVSREKIIFDIWRIVKPIDSIEPPEGPVSSPTTLKVNVIDPAVINVDWTVDGAVVAMNGGPVYDVAASKLASGTHTVVAKAYDNAPESLVRAVDGTCADKNKCWNRDAWKNSQQTVTWMVTIP